jgi:hypothetical protein
MLSVSAIKKNPSQHLFEVEYSDTSYLNRSTMILNKFKQLMFINYVLLTLLLFC